MRRLGQHRNPPPALPDGALPVPHQHPRHPAELVEELPPAGKQVLGHPRQQQPRGQPAGIAGHHHQHRQPGRRAGLAEPHRQGDIGKPQVALGHLPSRIRRPRRRVRWQIHRAQLPHAVLEHRQRPGPADPLGDHRGRHRRPRRQQLPDPRLGPIHDRPSRRPRIPRWAILGQRPLHRILGDPITRAIALTGICSARRSRRISAQSSTFNTLASSPARLQPGSRRVNFQASSGGQFSRAVDTRTMVRMLTGPPPRHGIEPRYEEKGWCSLQERSTQSPITPTAMTSNDASITSRRPQPSDMPVSLVGGAPRGAPHLD
jgi:hypothetical protein